MISSDFQDRFFVARYLSEVARLMTAEGGLRSSELFALRHDTERVVAISSAAALKGPLALPVLTAYHLVFDAMKGQPEISEPPLKSPHELLQDGLMTFLDKAQLDGQADATGLYTNVLRKAFDSKPTAALAHRLLRHAPTRSRASSFIAHEMNRCLKAEIFEDRAMMFQIAPTPQALAPMALSPVLHAQVAFHYGALASESLTLGDGRGFCAAVRAIRAFAVIGLQGPYSEDRDNLFGIARRVDICLMQRYVSDNPDCAMSLAEKAEGLRLLIELNDPVFSRAATEKAVGLFKQNDLKNETGFALTQLATTGLMAYPVEETFYNGLLRLAEGYVSLEKPQEALFALESALIFEGDAGAATAHAMKEILTNPLDAGADLPRGFGMLSAAQFNAQAALKSKTPRSAQPVVAVLPKAPAC